MVIIAHCWQKPRFGQHGAGVTCSPHLLAGSGTDFSDPHAWMETDQDVVKVNGGRILLESVVQCGCMQEDGCDRSNLA